MTTIAFDGRTIAADRLCGEVISVCKLFRIQTGEILAGAGDYSKIIEVAAWLQGEADKPELPDQEDTDFLLVDATGHASWLTWPWLRRVRVTEPFCAIGSGRDFALGAMAAGASAKKAVEIAARFDPSTGGGIDTLRVRVR